ncbi:MAG: 2-hydroxyacyl-CoA dehydratase, partial [Clostridiales Family XIII bacterium]|nr:2-hydroxyacyl-CoA dehydratase [Clostridiales Family XIII bacterium]
MNQFKKIYDDRHGYARDWKARTGGKVFGYIETYMPEEIVYAAGILPVRLFARHEADDVTDHQMHGNCYATKDILRSFIKGEYDYVDGLVHAEGCQWAFHCFQNIVNNKNTPDFFDHYVFVPDYPDARTSKVALRSEMEVFKKHIEQWTGQDITEEAIDRAIEVYNRNRHLLRRLYELRKADFPKIKGSEAMEIVLTCQVMDKAEANELLADFLKEAEGREPGGDAIRVMLIGSETWDAELERLIESLGGNVVIDELDNGTSYFLNEVIWQQDRFMALAHRYLERPHHAIKDNNWRRRPEHIYRLYEDWQADCVLIVKQIYCHPHGTDNYAIWKMLRERYVPYHFFERDTTFPKA